MNNVNTNYNSTEHMIDKLQELKGKTNQNFYENISNYYDIMNFQMDEDAFSKNAQGIRKIYHDILMLMKVLQTKPQLKNINNNYYDLYYTVIKNRKEKEIVDNDYENDYNNFNDVVPNHYIGIKPRETILK